MTETEEAITTITIVHCWSAPRSRSTAFLYSFESRSVNNNNNNNNNNNGDNVWGEGGDTIALDEPLYHRWLSEKVGKNEDGGNYGGISRPYAEYFLSGVVPPVASLGRDELLEGEEEDWRWERERQCQNERIYRSLLSIMKHCSSSSSSSSSQNSKGGIIFLKQMAKFSHLFDFETNFEKDETLSPSSSSSPLSSSPREYKRKCLALEESGQVRVVHRHVLLVRDPVSVLHSWMGKSGHVHGNNPHPDEVGIVQLLDVYSKIAGANMAARQEAAIVVDSDDLASSPRASLQRLCQALGIDFRDAMLRWNAGRHRCDGPWARWWYHDVWQSSGWGAPRDDSVPRAYRTVPPGLLPALRMCLPAYEFLRTLTHSHRHRAVCAPPSGRLFEDARNQHVLVYVGAPSFGGRARGRLLPRDMAGVSPFDSSVQGGDATWEGIRVYDGRIFHLDRHLDRLFRSAKALGFQHLHTRQEVIHAIFQTLAANGMRDGAHMRLTLTRGEKCTSSMNPHFNVYGTTLIILPEWKPTEGATTYDNTRGVSLITAGAARRSPPSTLDNKIHHNNMIQNILAKCQANLAQAADAIMLDVEGFVSETNATNLFMVRYENIHSSNHNNYIHQDNINQDNINQDNINQDNINQDNIHQDNINQDNINQTNEPFTITIQNHKKVKPILITPSPDHCLPGITRDTILQLANELRMQVEVRRVSLSEFYSADEVFTTGTMGELTPVTSIDGRVIGNERGIVTFRLQQVYKEAIKTRLHWSTDIPPFS